MEEALCPIEQRFRNRREVRPEEGGFPRRERPWAAVIDKRPAVKASCPPAAQAIPESPEGLSSFSPRTDGVESRNPQAQPRSQNVRPLSAGLRSEPAHDDFGTRIDIITPPGVSFLVASTVTPVLRMTSTARSIEP